ncbi:SDR family oxidoreductase [Spongiactinospora gelatinilytica]|uniref:SDR family oxidoreductase n=1 Tax=Spongiactinospora gelatinilytica TaxID=2666298 RepID=UPI003F66119D
MSASRGQGMILILARELRGRDITVNAVAPGPTATPLFLNGKDEATIATLAKAAPLERLGEPATSPRPSPIWPVRPAGSAAR